MAPRVPRFKGPGKVTVRNRKRVKYPGIYKSPDEIADDARKQWKQESPALQEVFDVTRDDLKNIALGQRGTYMPALMHVPRGPNESVRGVMREANAMRLRGILERAMQDPELSKSAGWYVMDPLYQKMVAIYGPEHAPAEFDKLRNLMASYSPGSDVESEIIRSSYPWSRGMRYAERPHLIMEEGGTGHPYAKVHGTLAANVLQGKGITKRVKVGPYAMAHSAPGVPFNTELPIADAHFVRGIGLSDTRQAAKGAKNSIKPREMAFIGPWYRDEVTAPLGIPPVSGQSTQWTVLGPQTGVDSPLGPGKLELTADRIAHIAKREGKKPADVLTDYLAKRRTLEGVAGAGVLTAAMAPTEDAEAASPAPYFSLAAQLAREAPQAKATAKQWYGMLKNKGAKDRELFPVLDPNSDEMIERGALTDMFEKAKPDIQETMLGAIKGDSEAYRAALEELRPQAVREVLTAHALRAVRDEWLALPENAEMARLLDDARSNSLLTQAERNALQNFNTRITRKAREIAREQLEEWEAGRLELTPEQNVSVTVRAREALEQQAVDSTVFDEHIAGAGTNYRELLMQWGDESMLPPASHWDTVKPVLSSALLEDVTVPGGPASSGLHISELQSDWNQPARKNLLGTKPDPKSSIPAARDPVGYRTPDEQAEVVRREAKRSELMREHEMYWKRRNEAWHSLAGVDPSSAEHAAIREEIRQLDSSQHDISRRLASDFAPDDSEMTPLDKVAPNPWMTNWDRKTLERVITEAARAEQPFITWSTGDTIAKRWPDEVAAEGNRYFYDQKMVSMARDIGKKYGVAPVKTTTDKGQEVWRMDLPAALREKAKAGWPVYALAGGVGALTSPEDASAMTHAQPYTAPTGAAAWGPKAAYDAATRVAAQIPGVLGDVPDMILQGMPKFGMGYEEDGEVVLPEYEVPYTTPYFQQMMGGDPESTASALTDLAMLGGAVGPAAIRGARALPAMARNAPDAVASLMSKFRRAPSDEVIPFRMYSTREQTPSPAVGTLVAADGTPFSKQPLPLRDFQSKWTRYEEGPKDPFLAGMSDWFDLGKTRYGQGEFTPDSGVAEYNPLLVSPTQMKIPRDQAKGILETAELTRGLLTGQEASAAHMVDFTAKDPNAVLVDMMENTPNTIVDAAKDAYRKEGLAVIDRGRQQFTVRGPFENEWPDEDVLAAAKRAADVAPGRGSATEGRFDSVYMKPNWGAPGSGQATMDWAERANPAVLAEMDKGPIRGHMGALNMIDERIAAERDLSLREDLLRLRAYVGKYGLAGVQEWVLKNGAQGLPAAFFVPTLLGQPEATEPSRKGRGRISHKRRGSLLESGA